MRGKLARLFAILLGLGAAAISIPLVLGFLGALHPAFDSFSHFRIHIAATLALAGALMLLFRGWRLNGTVALALAVAAVVATLGLPFGGLGAQASGETPRYRLLQMNLRFDNPQPEAVLSTIGEVRPDVITLNEISDMWREKLALLEAAYPYRIICPQPSYIGGVGILSRRPFAGEPRCEDRGAMAVAQVDFGGETIDVATLHLGWPWPFEQPWQLPHVEPTLAQLGDTAIIAGDLNAVPWSQTARRISQATGARILRGIGPTWLDYALPDALRPLIGLPIDNVLVKGGVIPLSVHTLDEAGSDHLPVLLEFSVPPQEQPAPVQQAALRE